MTSITARWSRFRYHLYAPFYNTVVRPLARSRQRAIEVVDVQPGTNVLLVGCGTGLDVDFLPPSVQVTAIDITPIMVERTIKRAQMLGRSLDASVMNAPPRVC